jgi:hypothetical protein
MYFHNSKLNEAIIHDNPYEIHKLITNADTIVCFSITKKFFDV